MSSGKKTGSRNPFGGTARGGRNAMPPYPAAKMRGQQRRKHCGSHRGNPKNFQIH